MSRLLPSLLVLAMILAACAPAQNDPETVYRIGPEDSVAIQDRMLTSVNDLRRNVGAQPLSLNPQLSAAAATHARDMSAQHRAWPFGANGSSPYDRVRQAGYGGFLVGETYAQSYESELNTLTAWIEDDAWREEILKPQANEMGLGWSQDSNGLIWWTLTLGDNSTVAPEI